MFRKHRPASASAAELPTTHRFFYTVLAVVLFAATGAILVLPYLWRFPTTGEPVSATVSWTLVQSVAAVACGVLFLYAVGRVRLEHSAWTAGQLAVTEFDDRRSTPADGPSAVELTARFEHKLTESRIYRTAAVPDTGRVYDVIQIVENAGDAASASWWKVASRLIRLVRPPSAFRVTAVILDGEEAGRWRVVLELLRLPRFTSTPLVIEDEDWDRLLERAANSVSALVFPVTKLCREEQWAAWRNCAMPTELFDAYQRAHQLQAARRYDEALAEFYRALEHDPSNVYIRLEIGQLQERLDLYLDALATYDHVIVIGSRENSGLSDWWNSDDFVVQRRWQARHRSRALLLARYRHALVLGLGDRIAEQWWLPPGECGHDEHWDPLRRQRAYLRLMLKGRFERYGEVPVNAWQPIETAARRTLDEILSTDPLGAVAVPERGRRAVALRYYLCTLAQYEFERLVADSRLFSAVKRFAGNDISESVSPCSLRIGLVWATMRRAMAKFAVDGTTRGIGAVHTGGAAVPASARLFDRAEWPPKPERLSAVIDDVMVRHARWHEHYSAACVFAVALLPSDGPVVAAPSTALSAADREKVAKTAVEREKVAKAAVRQLHWAAAETHTGFLARRRPWLMFEDPDLDSLRGSVTFRNFEMLVFSPERSPSLRPHGVKALELAFYQSQLVAGLANDMAATWKAREPALSAAVDSRTRREWHSREERAWRQVTLLAVGHRDWQTRRQAVVELRSWSTVREGGRIDPVRYTEDTLYRRYAGFGDPSRGGRTPVPSDDPAIEEIDAVALAYIADCERRLNNLARELHELGGGVDSGGDGGAAPDPCENAPSVIARTNLGSTGLARWIDMHATGNGEPPHAHDRVALWESLADWFDDEDAELPAGLRQKAFHEALRS